MIDWKTLAEKVGSLKGGNEFGSDAFALKAIEALIGEQSIREAVDYYIQGEPGSELARSVIRQIRPKSAMDYCYEIYKNDSNLEHRRMAIELLRVAADHNVVPWIEEFLSDDDPAIRTWGFGIIDQLLWSELVKEAEVSHLIVLAEKAADENLLENIEFVKSYLKARKEHEELLEGQET